MDEMNSTDRYDISEVVWLLLSVKYHPEKVFAWAQEDGENFVHMLRTKNGAMRFFILRIKYSLTLGCIGDNSIIIPEINKGRETLRVIVLVLRDIGIDYNDWNYRLVDDDNTLTMTKNQIFDNYFSDIVEMESQPRGNFIKDILDSGINVEDVAKLVSEYTLGPRKRDVQFYTPNYDPTKDKFPYEYIPLMKFSSKKKKTHSGNISYPSIIRTEVPTSPNRSPKRTLRRSARLNVSESSAQREFPQSTRRQSPRRQSTRRQSPRRQSPRRSERLRRNRSPNPPIITGPAGKRERLRSRSRSPKRR